MRRIAVLASQAALLWIFATNVHAVPSGSGLGFGVQGCGNQWAYGSPTARWWVRPCLALDFTPSISYTRNNTGRQNYELRVEAGCVPIFHARDNLLVGLRVAPAYRRYVDPSAGNERAYSIDLSLGPDLEYVLPFLPQISIAAQSVIRVRYTQIHWYGFYAGYTEVKTLGQWLTIRYYF